MLNQKSAQIPYLKRQGSISFFHGEPWRTWKTWKASNSWLNTFYLWFQKLYLWFKSIFLSNGCLKTLYLLAFMVSVRKLQPTGIVLAGCCTYTQSNNFIHLAKRCCIVSISNHCAKSQFLWWTLQPCFVLKSRPQKKQKNFSSFALSSRSSSIIFSRFGLLAVGLCSSGQ